MKLKVNYSNNHNLNPVNRATRLPKRPEAEIRDLDTLVSDEALFLAKKGQKTPPNALVGIRQGAIPRPNYEVSIQYGPELSKFFACQKALARDVFVHNSPLNGAKLPDGQVQGAVTSSFNTLADTVTLLRKVENEKGESYCYSGRVDLAGQTPTAKAEEVAQMIFVGEFDGKAGKGIEKVGKDLYTLQFTVQSTLNSATLPILKKEHQMLKDEILAYRLLAEKTKDRPMEIYHPGTRKTYRVQVLPPLIAQTPFNWTEQMANLSDTTLFGQDAADAISKESDAILFDMAMNGMNPIAKATAKQLIEYNGNKAWEIVMLRAYLCHLLNLPQLIHCKSSTDRTGVAIAIVSALRNYLESKRTIPVNILEIVNESTIDKDANITYPFKELFAVHLRKGLVETQISRAQVGYKLNRGWYQCRALQDLLPPHLLTKAPRQLLKKIALRVSCFIASLLILIGTLGGLLKVAKTGSLKGFDVWINPIKAFRPNVFPTHVVDETTPFGQDLLFKK